MDTLAALVILFAIAFTAGMGPFLPRIVIGRRPESIGQIVFGFVWMLVWMILGLLAICNPKIMAMLYSALI